MTRNAQSDMSQYDQPLAAIHAHVDDLHIFLDGFANGTTRQLSGDQTRHAVYQALDGLDRQIKELQLLRAAAAPKLRGYVTVAMRDKLNRVRELFATSSELLGSLRDEARSHDAQIATRQGLSLLATEIRSHLDRLAEEMHSAQPDDVKVSITNRVRRMLGSSGRV